MGRHYKTKSKIVEVPVSPLSNFSVKVNITFTMSDENNITVSLNGNPGPPITESTTITLKAVNHNDIINVDGIGEGDTTITIDKETSPVTPDKISSGPVHRNYYVI